MPQFNVYYSDDHGKFDHAETIEAVNDAQAVELASMSRKFHDTLEVWDGQRLVARITSPRDEPVTITPVLAAVAAAE